MNKWLNLLLCFLGFHSKVYDSTASSNWWLNRSVIGWYCVKCWKRGKTVGRYPPMPQIPTIGVDK